MKSLSTTLLLIAVASSVCAQRGVSALGIAFQDMDPALAAQLDLEITAGVVVTHVLEGRSAAIAGVQPNDIVTHMDGVALDTNTFASAIRERALGSSVTLRVVRHLEIEEIAVTLDRHRHARIPAVDDVAASQWKAAWTGLTESWRSRRKALLSERRKRQEALRQLECESQSISSAVACLEDRRENAEAELREERSDIEREREAIAAARRRLDEQCAALDEREHALRAADEKRSRDSDQEQAELETRRQTVTSHRGRLEGEIESLGRRIANLLRRLERPEVL